ncbi:SEC7 domain-containing protein [Favolaschia claudopus]|uniref:SEC7 domain-containing protein n=1 Tax=Favolaschia claudopus TaxID=2862362 RepID=A0AAW0BBQ7_9AGAR
MAGLPAPVPRRTVSQKHVLYSEILAVTSAMRKNSRWSSATHFINSRDSALGSNLGLRVSNNAQNSRRISREADLILGFEELKRAVRDVEDIMTVPLPTLLVPFFAIIRSPLSTGPITSTALASLHSFFVCGLISPQSRSLETALIELSSTVSHCKFEASDSSGDEVVLLRIMTAIHDCLCGGVGGGLGDIEVCEMLETVLTTCCQMRLSETLRRSAENVMHSLVRTVFSRLHSLDPRTEEEKLLTIDEDTPDAEIRMTVSASAEATLTEESPQNSQEIVVESQEKPEDAGQRSRSHSTSAATISRPEYGLPSILELLRVLINVLDPTDQQHTDSTHSFSNLARSENMSVLHSALRTISTVFDTMRYHLKLQQELFLAFTIDRLAPPAPPPGKRANGQYAASPRPGTPVPGTPILGPPEAKQDSESGVATPSRVLVAPARGETRDLILETMGQISRHPSFMVDLYINYDCDINSENLFERLIDFLTKGVYPPQSTGGLDSRQRNSQYLCLDLLLAFVNDMAARADGDFPESESLLQAKSQKKRIVTAAARFNNKPKQGVAFLEENRLIYTDLPPDAPESAKVHNLAVFLKGCARLDKRLLGDYISREENLPLLKAFIGLFDFRDKTIADAMRELLETFRLPGESQQIARITETFASIYFASEPDEIQNEDAVYVLAYSVIMLNTDQHNPQVRQRMTIEDYTKNLRGVNNNSDFSAEFLQNIYDSIRRREIVMPEEHVGQLGFEYAWKDLLTRTRNAGNLLMCNSSLFDVDMFKAVWKPVISAIAYAFITFDDDYVIQRSISGFRQCATLAGHFQLPDVFDFVVISLSQATSLLSEFISGQVPNFPVVDVEGQAVTVSNLSVKFGTNSKGQLAAVVLFNIVNGNGNALREGWTQIFEMFQNLFLHSLLPTRMLQMEDFLGGVSMIPLRGGNPRRAAPRSDGGLLSALSSYLMTPYGGSSDALVPDATEADVENTLCAIDCITSCRLDELYSQIMQLDVDALIAAVRALEALAHDRTVARLKQGADDDSTHPSSDDEPYALPYDPASVFLLETMVSIACQTSQHIEDLWPIVFEHLSALLSASTQYSFLLIERAVVALLRLCLIIAKKPALRDQIYVSFDLLSCLPPSVANSVAEQIVAGVLLLVQTHQEIIRSQTEWNLVFALLRSTILHPEAARPSFDLITSLVSDSPEETVTIDNFSGLLNILDDFATAAGAVAEGQHRQGRRQEPLTSANSPPIERGKKAIDLIVHLKKFMSPLMESAGLLSAQAWRQLCLPLISSLSRQSTNAAREVRHAAIGQLQRMLLGPHVLFDEANAEQVEEIFNRVIFPLLDDLLKPQVFHRDPRGMPETRLRASALLCKAFMHFEVRESQAQVDIRILWIQILDLLDRLMNIDKGDQLYEAVPESLKNVVLVMHAAQILVPPPAEEPDTRDDRQRTLWTATNERVERFLPGFIASVIPKES